MALENEEGLDTSTSATDNDVTEESSTSTDVTEESSTSTQEPETAEDAISDALGLKEDGEGTAEGEADGDEAETGKDEEKDVEGKDAKPEEEGADKKGEEEDLYKEPEGLKEQAQKRFHTLVESHKEVSAQLVERDETIGEFQKMVVDSGASPEEFSDLLRYSQMATSGDLEGALAMLDRQREALAKAMGKALPGVDLLADFPDLQEQVEGYKLTEEAALEIATARRNDARVEQQRKQQDEQANAADARTEDINTAAEGITKLADHWSANDIDYPAKHDKLMKRAAEIAKKYPPSEWAPMLEDYYNVLTEANASVGTTRKTTTQPLRPGGGSGGSKEPSNAADAVSQALGLGD